MGFWMYVDDFIPSGGGGGGCGTGCGCIAMLIVFGLILKYGGGFWFALIAAVIIGGVIINWIEQL